MDFTDASPFDVDAAIGDIRHGILRSIILGLVGMAVAVGGYAYDQSATGAAGIENVQAATSATS